MKAYIKTIEKNETQNCDVVCFPTKNTNSNNNWFQHVISWLQKNDFSEPSESGFYEVDLTDLFKHTEPNHESVFSKTSEFHSNSTQCMIPENLVYYYTNFKDAR